METPLPASETGTRVSFRTRLAYCGRYLRLWK
jgi:hypothetical protein